MQEEYLGHFGISGMKWGHRKQEFKSGSLEDRRIRKFENEKNLVKNRHRINRSINKRGFGKDSVQYKKQKVAADLLDKANKDYDKIFRKYASDPDALSKRNDPKPDLDKARKKVQDAEYTFYKAANEYSKAGRDIYNSLNKNQKLQVIHDVNVEKGKDAVKTFAGVAITAIGVGALVSTYLPRKR